MPYKIELTPEGANELREWSKAIESVVARTMDATVKLFEEYESVSEEVGPHKEQFHQMLLYVKKFKENSEESLTFFKNGLNTTADAIDEYWKKVCGGNISEGDTGGGNPSSPQKVKTYNENMRKK